VHTEQSSLTYHTVVTLHKKMRCVLPATNVHKVGVVSRRPAVKPARLFVCNATAEDDQPRPPVKVEDAMKLLGVSNLATFDEVLRAKNALYRKNDGNQAKLDEVEAAYDVMFMQSMKKRLSGEIQVSQSVRFADVPSSTNKVSQMLSGSPASPRMALPQNGSLPSIAIEKPQQQDAITYAAVYGTLAAWGIAQVLFESPESQLADSAGLQLALGLAFAIYTFRAKKKMELGKAVGLSFVTLFAMTVVGSVIHNWLRVDIVPIEGFGSPGVFVVEFILLGFGLATAFFV
jgi:hypothetical protein